MFKPGRALDERNRAVIGKITTILYIFTIYYLVADMIIREFFLHQSPRQFEDIAILVTVNVFLFIGLVLYFGGVSIGKMSLSKSVVGYVLFVVLGIAFTTFKYRGQPFALLFDKAVVVVTISAALFASAIIIAYLGKRNIERNIE